MPDRTAIIAVSRPGAALARRLAASLDDAELHLERRIAADGPDDGAHLYDLPLRPVLQELFARRPALAVFLPVGAVVRLLAPVLGSKSRDPAVVCIDDAGRYAVSLLSGHRGGADALARRVADAIGAQAVITSAADALSLTAIDLVGKRAGWRIDASPTDLTRAAAAVVNGEPVALWLDPATDADWPAGAPLSGSIVTVAEFADAVSPEYAAALAVSDRAGAWLASPRPLVIYRPPTLAIGIGCRRGVSAEHLRALLAAALKAHGLAEGSIAAFATADIKADEAGIIALAHSRAVPLAIYTAAELNAAGREMPDATPSAAQDLLGVFGVSEPAALLSAGADRLVMPRVKSDRATIAAARIPPARENGATDTAEDIAMTHRETTGPGAALLAAAEREISQGNHLKGAELVWQATMAAVSAAAARHGIPCRNREEARQFVKQLDNLAEPSRIGSDPGPVGRITSADLTSADSATPEDLAFPWNLAGFGVADSFRNQYENRDALSGTEFQWEPEEFAIFLDPVRYFIATLSGNPKDIPTRNTGISAPKENGRW